MGTEVGLVSLGSVRRTFRAIKIVIEFSRLDGLFVRF